MDKNNTKNKDNLKGQDGAHYIRQQKGHSAILAIIFGGFTLYILPIYWLVSKNHYYHL